MVRRFSLMREASFHWAVPVTTFPGRSDSSDSSPYSTAFWNREPSIRTVTFAPYVLSVP